VKRKSLCIALCLCSIVCFTNAQSNPEKKSAWYETFSIRGYVQARYNRLLETNGQLKCEQCDRSWGNEGGFFLRRVRVILFGQVNKNVYFYIQPDLASAVSTTTQHFAQL
jgi:hypothetical protein